MLLSLHVALPTCAYSEYVEIAYFCDLYISKAVTFLPTVYSRYSEPSGRGLGGYAPASLPGFGSTQFGGLGLGIGGLGGLGFGRYICL